MTDASTIGWTYQGRNYTPADPCTFADPVRCTPFDTEQWERHARAWVDTARTAAADNRDAQSVVGEISAWIDRIVSESCTVFGCHVQVAGLIEAAKAARTYATIWSDAVDAPNTDPWSTKNAEKLAEQARQNVGNWISDAMKQASKAVQDTAGQISWLPWLALVLLVAVAGGRRW